MPVSTMPERRGRTVTDFLLIIIIILLLAIFGRIDRALKERSKADAGNRN